MCPRSGPRAEKKSRRRRGRSTSGDGLDEEQPLPVHDGEAEFSNSANFNADNEAVVNDVDDVTNNNSNAAPDDGEDYQQPTLTLVPNDGDDDAVEDAMPAPIEEPDANAGSGEPDAQPGFTEEGLAVAMAVDTAAEDEYIYAAIEYDPDSKPPLHKNRRFRVYTCLAFVVITVVVAVVVVSTTKSAKGVEITEEEVLVNGPPTGSPTPAPTTDREASGIREQIEAGILQRGASFADMGPTDPRARALEWILHYDELELDSDDKNLYQRYVLALLAFALDSLAWAYCGEHRKFGNTTEFFVSEDCQVPNRNTGMTEDSKVWLSSTEECEWFGVICSNDEVVRGVELIGNGLIGEIPPEISQLRFLQYLAVNGNCLFGTIPPEFGKMPNLLSLELHGNGLSGELPMELYDANKLQLLNVAWQYQLQHVCHMSNGTRVNTLYQRGGVTSVDLNSGLWGKPLEGNVSRWKSMKGLYLFTNSFSGSIADEVGDLKYLVFLHAYDNLIFSPLSDGVMKLKKLRELLLHKNNLYYEIPTNIGHMEDLEDLRLFENEMDGPIPESLYTNSKLKKLWLQDTKECKEKVGGELECTPESNFGFTGTISKEIGNLKKLQHLLLNNNPLGGTLPTEIGLCEDLAILHIHQTNIEGSAPIEMCRLRDKKLNSESNEGVLYADCRPNNRTRDPFFACDCCSDCCDHTTKVCIADD